MDAQDSDFLGRLIVGFLGVAVGAAVTWVIKVNEAHDRELADRINDSVKELENIEKISIAAWERRALVASAAQPVGAEQDITAAEVEGRLHRLTKLINFAGNKVPGFDDYKTDDLLITLRRACTYDEVRNENLGLPPANQRAKSVIFASTEVLLTLRMMQRDVLPLGKIARWRRLARIPANLSDRETRSYWTVD